MSLFVSLIALAASTASVFGSVPIKVKSIKSIELPQLALRCASNCGFPVDQNIGVGSRFDFKLGLVNRIVNEKISYRSDMEAHGVTDVWSSPDQTIESGYGDCEDYAILKRALLINFGVDEKDMDIVVVNDEGRQVLHAVLAVRHHGEVYVLDNLKSEVLKQTYIKNYTPLISVSQTGFWIHGKKVNKADKGADS